MDCPEEYGGAGLDLVSSVLMKLKFYEYGWPALTLPGGALELDNILTYGSKEQQELIVEEVLQGRKAYTMGFTEPQAGSDNSAMATRAEHRDGKVYITGHKTFNTYATVSRYMMCVAREYEVEDKPKKDMSWYLIPLRDEAGNLTPGVPFTFSTRSAATACPHARSIWTTWRSRSLRSSGQGATAFISC